MDERLLATMVFAAAGGLLGTLALGTMYQVLRFRRSACSVMGTVVEAWVQAVKARSLESSYREEGPRRQRGAYRAYAHRTRWIRVRYVDSHGESREFVQLVYGRGYATGQPIPILYHPQQPTDARIDSPLELYRKPALIGVLSMGLLIIAVCVWSGVVPLASH